jgi:hypothetical protein
MTDGNRVMMRLTRRCAAAFVVVALAMLVGGCNRSPNVNISGHIEVDGEPLATGDMVVSPADGQGAVVGASIKDGDYSVSVPPGKKVIRITGYKLAGQRQLRPGDPKSPVLPVVASAAQQTVEYEVTGGGTKDFSLTTQKKK